MITPGVHGETTVKMMEQISRDLGNYIDRKLLEKDREQMIAAIEQTGEDVIITDVEGTIEYVNPVFEQHNRLFQQRSHRADPTHS